MQMWRSDFFLHREDIISSAETGWKPWGSRFLVLPAPPWWGNSCHPSLLPQIAQNCGHPTRLLTSHLEQRAQAASGIGSCSNTSIRDTLVLNQLTPGSITVLPCQTAWANTKILPRYSAEKIFTNGDDSTHQLQRLIPLECAGFGRDEEENKEEKVPANKKSEL